MVVCELRAGLHHVEQGHGQLPCNSVRRLLLFAGLLLEVVSPYAEHLVVVVYEPVRALVQRLVEWLAAAAHDGARNLPGTDFEARVEAAVSGQCFCVSETARCDDPRKPDDGSQFPDLRGSGKDADHLVTGKRAGVGLPFHGTGFLEDPGPAFLGLCGKAVVLFVLAT